MTIGAHAEATVADLPRTGWRLLAIPVALCGGVLIASFLKADLTHNDFERFDDLRLSFLFFGLIAVACLSYAALWRERPTLSASIVVGGAIAGAVFLLASFPVGSKDAFLYAFFGKVWGTYHTNPYTTPPSAFAADPWRPFGEVVWAEQPAPYGPLFLWQARVVDAVAAGRLFVAVWTEKVIATAALAAAVVIGAQLMNTSANVRWCRIALLVWNPLLLFESAGNGHNDAVMLLLLLGAVWLHTRDGMPGRVLAPTALAFAIWYKWYAVLYVPAFLVAVYRDGGRDSLRRWLIVMTVATLVSGLVLFAPLAEALPLLVRRLVDHENLHQVFPLQLSPLLAVLLWGLETTGQVGGRWPLMWFDIVRAGAFALTVIVLLVWQWRGRIGLTESLCGLSAAFTLLLVTILWPWHLEVPVALALIATSPVWRGLGVFLTLMGLLSYFLTFVWSAVLLVLLAAALRILRWRSAVRSPQTGDRR